MTKRAKVKKERKKKTSKAALRIILGRQHFGPTGILGNGEPAAKEFKKQSEVDKACSFYRQAFSDGLPFLEEYVTANGPKELDGWIKYFPEGYKHHRACWIARMLTLGISLPLDAKAILKDLLKEFMVKLPDAKAAKQTADEVKLDKVKPKYFAADLKQLNVSLLLRPKFSKASPVKTITKFIEEADVDVAHLQEFRKSIVNQTEGFDKDFFKKVLRMQRLPDSLIDVKLKERIDENAYHLKLIEALDAAIGKAPASEVKSVRGRKPRKRREKTAEQIVKRVKHLEKDDATGVTSIDPTKVVGAKVAYVYDAGNRLLRVFVATDDKGLTFIGSKIGNFDSAKSVKAKLRKPRETLAEIVKSPQKIAEKVMGDLTTKVSMLKQHRNRTNARTVFVKVF